MPEKPIHPKMEVVGLEVDGRHRDAPIPYQSESEGFKYVNGDYNPPNPVVYPSACTLDQYIQKQGMSKPKKLSRGRKVQVRQESIFCCRAMFALIFGLAIVAAGVAGSAAVRRGRHFDTCMTTLQNLKNSIAGDNSTDIAKGSPGGNTTAGDDTSHVANSTCQNSNPATFVPTSDCSSLATPYKLPANKSWLHDNSFDVHCDTDFDDPAADFLLLTMFTFVDCIAACANFNQQAPSLHENLTCYAISYRLDVGENAFPGCYLKGIQNLPPTSDTARQSATLITG